MTTKDNRDNVKVPAEMDYFIDLLLRHPDIQSAGIKNRKELATLCFEIFLDRFQRLEAKRIDVKTGLVNATITKTLTKKMKKAANHPISKSGLWFPQKTNILGEMLRTLFVQYVPEYRKYSELVEVTAADLREATGARRK